MSRIHSLIARFCAVPLASLLAIAPASAEKPVKVYVPGTLKSVVGYDGKFKYLVDDKGEFIPRNDVCYTGVVTATANKWLDIGCGASSNSIGPELGFGHMVGHQHDEPILILKASQGNGGVGESQITSP